MKKIFFFLFIATCSLSLHSMYLDDGMTIQRKLTPVGTNWTMISKDKQIVGSINSIDTKHLRNYASITLDVNNKNMFSLEQRHLITVVKAFDVEHSLQDTAALECLHVFPAYRGKGFAYSLFAKACGHLLNQGIKKLLVIPDPFEYVDGKPTLLQENSQCGLKKHKLIEFFQKHGFIAENAEDVTYLHCIE